LRNKEDLMYTPPIFRDESRESLFATIRSVRLATLITSSTDGLHGTPLPLFLDESEGEFGVLYGHLAKANPQARAPAIGNAMAIFMGPDAYVTPTWYPAKRETEKVVPTWNYIAVHAYGPLELFVDPARLLEVVTRLTSMHEEYRPTPWKVSDAPDGYIQSQLRGIIGFRMPVNRIDGKRKLSQNKNAADRAGVAAGLIASDRETDRTLSQLVPLE
jgi:transcriptional regulator